MMKFVDSSNKRANANADHAGLSLDMRALLNIIESKLGVLN